MTVRGQRVGVFGALVFLGTVVAASGQPAITSCPTVPNGGVPGLGLVDGLPLAATGGTGPLYTWSLGGGALPPGLSIRTDLPPYITDPSVTAVLAGVATSAGTYNLTLTVTNNGLSSSLPCVLTVSSLIFKDPRVPHAFVGQSYAYTLTASRNGNQVFPTWSVNPLTPLPSGMSLDPATGQLSGTPAASGFYNVSVFADHGGEIVGRSLTLQVFDVAIISGANLPNATQGQPYATTIQASGGSGPYTFTVTGLPPGLAADPSGTIFGTTAARGPFTLNVVVVDQAGRSYIKSMSLDVVGNPKTLPAILPYQNVFDDCTINTPCSRGIGVLNGGTGPFTWSATNLPPGMSIRNGHATDAYSPKDGEVWGAPTQLGTFNVTITVTDFEGATATNTFALRISELGPGFFAPTAWMLGVPGQQRLRILGGPLPNPSDSTSYSASLLSGTPPLGVVLGAPPCTSNVDFCGTPAENIVTATRLRVSGPGGTQFDGTYSFNVGGGNSTIQITTLGNLGTFPTGMAYTRTLFACCTPNALTWTVIAGSLPSGFSLSPSGVLSGLATAGADGSYAFLVKAADSQDGTNFGVRQFTLSLVSNAITVSNILPTGKVGTAYIVTLSTLASGGTWSLNANNYLPPGLSLGPSASFPACTATQICGTPTQSGQYSFALTNSVGPIGQTFTISIYPATFNPPTFNQGNLTLSLGQVNLTQLTATGGSGTGYVFSLSPGASPVPGLRIQNGAPLPTSFPATGAGLLGIPTQTGVWPTSIRVRDSAGNFIDRPFTVTVAPIQTLSQATLPKARWGTFYSYQLEAYGGVGYTWSMTGTLCGLTISSTGLISGTPTQNGTTCVATTTLTPNVTVKAGGYQITNSFSITPNVFDITTNGKLPEGSVGTPYSVQLAAELSASWTSTALPAGFSLSSSGLLTNPNPNTVLNNSSFTVTATPASGPAVSKVFSLRVTAATLQILQITTPAPNAAGNYLTLGSLIAQQLVATGGVAPYKWSVTGSLPPGLSLPSDTSTGETLGATLAPGFMYLVGRPMQAGVYSFTLRVKDHGGDDQAGAIEATRSYTWIVTELGSQYNRLPPTPTNSTIAAGQPFTTNNQLLVVGGSASEGIGDYTWANTSPLPFGLTLNPATGVISGTPIEVTNTSYPIQVTDNVSGATLIFNVTLNVTGGTTPITIGQGSSLPTVQQGGTISTGLNIAGGTGPYTVTGSGLPPWMAINAGSGLFEGQSGFFLVGTAQQAGTFTFSITVEDSSSPVHQVSARTFTLTVAAVTLAVSNTLPDGTVGELYDYPLLTLTNNVVWSLAPGFSLPPGLVLAPIGGVYHLTGTPTVASATSYSFQLTSTDASGAALTGSFSLRIANARILDPQLLTATGIVGSPFTYQFTANCPTVNPCVTWSTGVPVGYTFDPIAGVLSTITTVPSAGSTTFNVTATPIGGGVAETRRFVLYTRWPNPLLLDFSLAATQLADATVGQATNQTLNPTGGVPPYSWSVAAGQSLPPGLTVTDWSAVGSPIPTATGASATTGVSPGAWTLSGIPTTPGLYTFDLILKDSVNAQVRRTFTLRVSPIGIVSGTVKAGVVGNPYSQQFLAFGGTGPATFTMTPVNSVQDMLPPGLAMNSSGLVSGTPESTGIYTFNLTVTQGGNTFTRRTTINVARAALAVNASSAARNLLVSNVNPLDLPIGVGRRSAPFTLNVSILNVTLLANGTAVLNGTTSPATGTYAWSIALKPGETFPPGMMLIDPASDFSESSATVLAGLPTQAGTFVFTLRATDTAPVGSATYGDYAEHTFTLRVAPMQMVSPPTEAFVAADLPSGRVNVPYFTQLRAAGGTAPYHFSESPNFPLPAGLTLADDGTLSGTPLTTFSGNIFPIVTDSSGNVGADRLITQFFLQIAPAGTTPHPLLFQTQALDLLIASPGVPYAFPLDTILRGGTPPFSWTLVSGSLPAGVALLPGSNNVSAYLGGVPQVAGGGKYHFSVKATDSASTPQEITLDLTLDMSNIPMTPDAVPPGQVGVPYSAQITSSGGVAPYRFAVYPYLDFPPGLTLEPDGTLHGTPTTAGNFAAGILVGDSYVDPMDGSSNFAATIYRFVIDQPNPGHPGEGEAPAVSLPAPIEVSYTQGSGSVAPIPVSVNATSSRFPGGNDIPFGVSVAGIPGANIAPTGTPTGTQLPGAVSLVLDHGVLDALSVTNPVTYEGLLAVRTGTPNQADAAANLLDQIHVKLTVLPQPPCAPTLTPAGANFPAAGGTGSFTITVGQGCGWTAVPSSPWITLQSQPSGSGSATLNFSVAPNPDPPSLAATIDVQYGPSQFVSFDVTQFGSACAFDINPKSVSATAAGGSAVVNVAASSAICDWPASDPGVTPNSGTGNGSVTVTVPPTNSQTGISYDITVAGLALHVNQSGRGCSFVVNPTDADADAAGGTGTVSVATATGCQYTTLVGPAWVTVTGGGSGIGPGTLEYAVEPNSATTPRSGTLLIGGTPFNIHQLAAACSVTVDTSQLGSPYNNGATTSAGIVGIATNGNNCSWSAASGASWASLSQYSGTTSVDVRIILQANNTILPRSTDLTIAGQTVSITQSGTQCTYGLQSSAGSIPAAGGLGTVGVVAPPACTWAATASTVVLPTWLHVLAQGAAGTSNVLFAADPNPPGSGERSGTIAVDGTVLVGDPPVATVVTKLFAVTQAPAPCSPTLTATSATGVSFTGTVNATVGFSSPNSCTPNVLSYADWIYDVQVSGSTVMYSVQSNPVALSRSGTIQIGDKTFTVSQLPATCAYRFNSYGSVFGQIGGNVTIAAAANNPSCPNQPLGTNQSSFITNLTQMVNAPGDSTIEAVIAAYNALTVSVRFGNITFGNQIHTVKQTSW